MLKDSPDPADQDQPPDTAWLRSELQFRRLLEKLPAGAYTCDHDGLITYYNQHAVKLWGRAPRLNDPADRFCGSFKLFAADGSPIAHDRCSMALALKEGKPYDGHEIVIERPDGKRLTVLAHANPIHDHTGRLLGAVNVLVDISERTQHEDALREADRSKNEFLATLAHELRNPLAPIRNIVQILQIKGPSAPDLAWSLDVIDRQVRQMTRLIDDLMDLSRITADKLQLRRERVSLADVLRTAVETGRPLIEANGHEFTVAESPQPVLVDADPTRLAQVISNLLINAAKYTPRGGKIWLHAEQERGDIVISVRDTGAGIPAELLPRIFDMFTQGQDGSQQAHEGLGIGLTLARRLVEMHGGTIAAHSDGPGRGSEFILRLPIVADRARMAKSAMRRRRATPSLSLRILVVDDNRQAAASLRTLLEILGNEVRVAHNGARALRVANEFRPEAALLDIGLPRLSGYELAHRLRRRPWGKDLLLIAMTSLGQEADRERSREAGFDHHLVKPVDPAALMQILESGRAPGEPGAPKPGNGHWEHQESVQVLPLPLGPR